MKTLNAEAAASGQTSGQTSGPALVLEPFRPEAVTTAIQAPRACAVIWPTPAGALATALQAGEAPSAALSRWAELADTLLALFRRNRRHLVLIAEDMLTDQASPQERALVYQRLGLTPAPDAGVPALWPGNVLADLLADLAVPRLDSLRGRIDELRASSLSPRPGTLQTTRLDAAASVLAEMQETLGLHRVQLAEQLDGLKAQLTAAQDQAARHAATVRTLQHQQTEQQGALAQALASTKALTQDLAEARQSTARLAARAEAAKTEIAPLLEELQAKTDRLAAHETLQQGLEAENSLLRVQIGQLQSQIAQERSRPAPQDDRELARLTDALAAAELALSRALSDLRAEATSRAEAERRAQSLGAQLDRRHSHEQDLIAARAQIARIMQDDTGLLDTIAAQQRALEAQSAREAELAAELAALHDRESGLSAEVAALHAEIERIMASRSWKVTEPLRGARRLLHKPAPETPSSEE